jgi:hypothetical protein
VLCDLYATYPELGRFDWKDLKPSEQRLAAANPGNFDKGKAVVDPMSDEAIDAQHDQDMKDRDTAANNKEAISNLNETMTATVGMKRRADGSYYGEETEADRQRQYTEVKGRVTEQWPTWETTITSLRGEAMNAKGKCNKLTSGGSWDAVPSAARKPYNEGYRLWNEGEQAWKAAQAAAKATGKGVMSFFPSVQSAKSAFQQCIDQFKAGDALS